MVVVKHGNGTEGGGGINISSSSLAVGHKKGGAAAGMLAAGCLPTIFFVCPMPCRCRHFLSHEFRILFPFSFIFFSYYFNHFIIFTGERNLPPTIL